MPHLTINEDRELLVKGVRDLQERTVRRAGGNYDPFIKGWVVAFTTSNLEYLLDKLKDVSVDPDVEEVFLQRQAKEEELLAIKKSSKNDSPIRLKILGLNGSLYNYQRYGVKYAMANGEGALIADEMGLGKSLQGLGIAMAMKNKGMIDSALIVVPASLKYNWPLEIEKWTNEKYVIIDGTADKRVAQWLRKDVFFYVVNYELLLEDLFGGREYKEKPDETPEQKIKRLERHQKSEKRSRVLRRIRKREWGYVCVDEIHMLKTSTSKRTENMKRVKAKFRVGLTGTPIDGRLEEMHSIMEFIRPGLLENRSLFLQRHTKTDRHGKIIGYKNIDELRERIEPYFIRRLKKDVLKQLPPKIYNNRIVTLSPKERKIYKSLCDKKHEVTEDVSALVQIIRCRQFCNHPSLVDEDMKGSKLEAFKDVVQEVVVDNAHKACIFSQWKETLDILVEELEELGISFLRIDGDTDTKDRALMQERFNESDDIDVMIGTEAMSTGLNFTGADYVINYDDNWQPLIMAQREDRCIIKGQSINTARGMVKIEDVEIGDFVLTHKGNYEKVLDTGNRLHRSDTTGGMTTSIKYKGFDELLMSTHDHKILALRGEDIAWIEACEVRPCDFLLSPTLRAVKGHNEGQWVGCIAKSGNDKSAPLLSQKADGYVCLPVLEVSTKTETRKDTRVYDLTVENDGSFVVGRAAVHNCHRIGQSSTVNVINFIVKDTIEERVRDVLYGKNKVSAEVLGDDIEDAVLMRISDPKELLKLL